jgi:hypothetical protein
LRAIEQNTEGRLVHAVRRLMFMVGPVLVVALLGACGGSSDDDPGDGTQPASQATRGGAATSAATSGDGDGGGGTDIPAIKDGNFSSGHVHVEISGDKDVTVDADGGGIASGGFALFTYTNGEASVQFAFQAGSEDDPGAVVITTSEVATAGEWGKDCEVDVDQSGTEVTGEFSCGKLDAIAPGSTDTYTVRVRGTFSAKR